MTYLSLTVIFSMCLPIKCMIVLCEGHGYITISLTILCHTSIAQVDYSYDVLRFKSHIRGSINGKFVPSHHIDQLVSESYSAPTVD